MTVEATYQIDQNQIQNLDLTIAITATVAEWEKVLAVVTEEKGYVPDCFSIVIRGVLRSFREATDPPYRVTRWGDASVDKKADEAAT